MHKHDAKGCGPTWAFLASAWFKVGLLLLLIIRNVLLISVRVKMGFKLESGLCFLCLQVGIDVLIQVYGYWCGHKGVIALIIIMIMSIMIIRRIGIGRYK